MMRSAQGLSVERSCLIVLAWRCLRPDSMSLRRPRVKASGWGVVVPLGFVGWDRGVSMDGEGVRGVWGLQLRLLLRRCRGGRRLNLSG